MGACPTCGHWSGMYLRVRRGGRAYVPPGDRRRFWSVRSRALVGGEGPTHAMRVYWPGDGHYRSCPDPWHRRHNWASHRSGPDGWGPDPYTGLNQHGNPDDQESKRKAKARRQRKAQSKQRR